MNEETLKAARLAEASLRQHHDSCQGGCRNLGAYSGSGLYGAERCDRGKELFTSWNAFRPEPLPGSRHTRGPADDDLSGHIIDETMSIGPYTVLRLLNDASRMDGVKEWQKHRRVEYIAYVDGKSTRQFWYDTDLDTVLLFAMDYRRNGSRTDAYYYAARVLGIPLPEAE